MDRSLTAANILRAAIKGFLWSRQSIAERAIIGKPHKISNEPKGGRSGIRISSGRATSQSDNNRTFFHSKRRKRRRRRNSSRIAGSVIRADRLRSVVFKRCSIEGSQERGESSRDQANLREWSSRHSSRVSMASLAAKRNWGNRRDYDREAACKGFWVMRVGNMSAITHL